MRLDLMTTAEARRAFAARPTAILPAGATEQHGTEGLIGTDALIAEAIARALGISAAVAVLPTLSIGMSQFHLGFSGSLSLRPSTLSAVVADLCAGLALAGVRRLLIVNGHGGNVAPIVAGVQEHHAAASFAGRAGGLHVLLRSWWEPPPVRALIDGYYGAAEGAHVTASEIAILRHLMPERMPAVAEPPARALTPGERLVHAGDRHHDAADFRARFPDGRVGSTPALADADQGRALFQTALDALGAELELFEATA